MNTSLKVSVPATSNAYVKTRKPFTIGNHVPLLVLIALCIIATFISDRFLTQVNLTNVLVQASILTVLTIGMTFVIVSGGFDLSVGSTAALAGCIGAMATFEFGVVPGLAAAVLTGCAVGILNGVIIAKLRVSPLIATLGTMVLLRGVVLLYTDGSPVEPMAEISELFILIGTGRIQGIPVLPCIVTVIFALAYWVLHHSTLGFRIFALGGNEQAASTVGIRIDRIKILAFTVCGVLAGVAGFLLSARLQSGQPTAGEFYELTAIAAVVLGGASLKGGEGKLVNSVIGVFIMVLLNNILNLAGVGTYWQRIAVGLVIVGAAAADQLRHRR